MKTVIICILLLTAAAGFSQTSRIALWSHSGKKTAAPEAGFGLPGDAKEKTPKKKAADTIAVKPFGTAAGTPATKKPRKPVRKYPRKKR